MIYPALFAVLILVRFVLARAPELRDQFYWVVLAGLFLFSAFRLEVGCDWWGYYKHFSLQYDLQMAEALVRRDPLWWVLVQTIGASGLSYPWLNVASSALFFGGIHILARTQPDRLGFLILLYPVLILNMPMSGIRQAAAIGLLAAAFVSFQRGNPLSYALRVVIGAGFHSSTAAFLLLVPLVGKSHPRLRLFSTAVLLVPGLVLLTTGQDAQLAISRYVNTGVDAQGALYRAGMLFLTGLLFVLALRKPWARAFPLDRRLVGFGALMMLATLPLAALSSVIGDRLGYFLVPLQAIILARLPFVPLGSVRPILSALPYLALLLMLSVWALRSFHFGYCYLPYDTWLFGLPDRYRSPL